MNDERKKLESATNGELVILCQQPNIANGDSKLSSDLGAGQQASQERSSTDTFHSWLVCLVAFSISGVSFTIHNNYGLLYDSLVSPNIGSNETQSAAKTAWVGSFGVGMNFAFSPFSSALTEHFGFRKVTFLGIVLAMSGLTASSFIKRTAFLFITYGLMFGVGSSLVNIPSLMALQAYFCRHISLANGIAASGSGVGTVVFSYVLRALLEKFGLPWTFRILGGSILALMLALPVLATPKWLKRNVVRGSKHHWTGNIICKEVWQSKCYIVMIIAIPVFLFGYFIPFVYLYRLAIGLGISKSDAAWLIPYMSITSVVGKIGFGVVLNHCNIKPVTLFQMSMFCMACCQFVVPFAKEYWMLCVYVALFGLFEGCFVGQIPVVVSSFVGFRLTGNALGSLFMFMAVMMMAGPPVAGLIYDATQSYDIPFYTAGASSLLGSMIMLVTLLPRFQKSIKTEDSLLMEVDGSVEHAANGSAVLCNGDLLRSSTNCLSTASIGQIRVIEKLTVL